MGFNNTRDRRIDKKQRAVSVLPFGEVQEWTIEGVQYHPFHTHGQPYQTVAMPSKEELVETLITHNLKESQPLGPYLNATIWSLIKDQGMMTYVDVEKGNRTCVKGARCATALDPKCYSHSGEAGFTLKVASSSLHR